MLSYKLVSVKELNISYSELESFENENIIDSAQTHALIRKATGTIFGVVAYDKDRPVGIVCVNTDTRLPQVSPAINGVSVIDGLYVAETYRHRGVAGKLLAILIDKLDQPFFAIIYNDSFVTELFKDQGMVVIESLPSNNVLLGSPE